MKTGPTVRLADTADAVALPDLPEEVRLAMTDIAGAAREGLLALSVAAGMAVMQAMFEAEIVETCGPKGKHNRGRAAVRHGSGKGSVTLGGRRVAVARPRARTLDGHEVPLANYAHFAADDLLTEVVVERMLAGVATRRHARTAEPVGSQVDQEAKSTSRSAISRRFVRQTGHLHLPTLRAALQREIAEPVGPVLHNDEVSAADAHRTATEVPRNSGQPHGWLARQT